MQSRQDFDDFLSLQIKNLEAKKCSELAEWYLEDYIKQLPKQFIDNYMNFVDFEMENIDDKHWLNHPTAQHHFEKFKEMLIA